MSDKIIASEALFGFMGWLTSRDEVLTVSATHHAAPAAEVVQAFIDANDLDGPRENWHKNFVHPEAQ
ncbi:MAG: hypothetical protein KAJ19_22910 [Gammaproteobacteria bacterium]|nr:hypothetical protein [Gammaproteobacteria bacterium]